MSVGWSVGWLVCNAFARRSTRRTLLAYLALFCYSAHPSATGAGSAYGLNCVWEGWGVRPCPLIRDDNVTPDYLLDYKGIKRSNGQLIIYLKQKAFAFDFDFVIRLVFLYSPCLTL